MDLKNFMITVLAIIVGSTLSTIVQKEFFKYLEKKEIYKL